MLTFWLLICLATAAACLKTWGTTGQMSIGLEIMEITQLQAVQNLQLLYVLRSCISTRVVQHC